MTKITAENYHKYLSCHGRSVEVARRVVEKYDDTEGYHTLRSVREWVEASKIVLQLAGEDDQPTS
jgi:hypothetical protein